MLALYQGLPAVAPTNTTLYTFRQDTFKQDQCWVSDTIDRNVSVYSSSEIDHSPPSKISQIFSVFFDTAASGVGRVFSAVGRSLVWLDSSVFGVSVAHAQLVNPSAAAAAQESEPIGKPLTDDEQIFLTDLEVYVRLVKNAPQDSRYLRMVKKTISTYLEKNKIQAFPAHMSRATELLVDYLTYSQFNHLIQERLEFGKPQPLSENCFYHQLNDAVKTAKMMESSKDQNMAVRVIDTIIEVYLASSGNELLPPGVLKKVGEITDKLGWLGIQMLTRTPLRFINMTLRNNCGRF
jgi:hypothetical protein